MQVRQINFLSWHYDQLNTYVYVILPQGVNFSILSVDMKTRNAVKEENTFVTNCNIKRTTDESDN